jgi:ATP-binding cassette subfamily F protein 3
MISLDHISKFYGRQDLLKEVSCAINPGDKIALVGVNGTGKTTLLKIILGRLEPDQGQVHLKKGLRIGYLPQEIIQLRGKSVIELVMELDADLLQAQTEYREVSRRLNQAEDPEEQMTLAARQSRLLEELERLGGYDLEARAKQILAGLGFLENQFSAPIETMSGGWIMRAALARMLLMKPDLLLLDEPTNHLDLDSLLWLENFLRQTSSALLLISHDRIFLDRVVQRIFELEKGLLTVYQGNYSRYREEKEKRLHFTEAAYYTQMEKIRQMEDFIARNRSRKDRARQVQSRIKVLEQMERLESPQEEKKISFQFNEPVRSGKVVLELKRVAKAFGGNLLYQDIDLTLTRGDCLAFLGPNGAGKSTLIKIMAGLIRPDRGERLLGHNVTLAYFAQNQLEQLTGERTVWQEVSGVAGDRTYGNLRNLLAAFLFRSDEEIQKKVSVLSGGEKSRLVILKMLLGGANFLLFDEPTNHLDIPSRDILEEALKSFNGTLCLITHDRHLIDALAGRVAYLKDGRLEIFPGNYQDFEQVWKGKIEAGPETGLNPARGPQAKAISGGKKDRREKREEADRRNALFRMKAPLQKEIAALEQEISRLEAEKETVEKTLADPDFYRAGSGIQGAQQRYGQMQKEIEELTARWGEALARLEALEKTGV